MKQTDITIINKLGLHIRASNLLVNTAQRFQSKIELIGNNKTADAKSIMNLMLLGAGKGMQLTLRVEGDDEEAAFTAIVDLINNRFNEAE